MKDALKKLVVLSLAAFTTASFLGCGVIDPQENEDNVDKMTVTGIGTITPGVPDTVTVEVETTPAVDSVTVSVTGPEGMVASSEIRVTGEDALDGKEKGTLELEVTAMVASVCNGDYTLKITVYAGTAEQTKNTTFSVAGGTNCSTPMSDITVATVTLGSWDHSSIGSSLDADAMEVYTDNAAAGVSASIDVFYSNEASGSNAFYSPAQAATISHPPTDWSTKNPTKMAVVSGVTFEDITLQSEIDSLWATVAEANKKQLVRLNAGDIVLVETDQGKIAMIKFISGDGTDTGTCQIKGTK